MDTNTFQEFESFPWDTDNDFNTGLNELLENDRLSSQDKQELILRAKAFYFTKRTGNAINIDEYKTWAYSGSQPDIQSMSASYQDIIDLILSGKPVPGIKEVPNIVLGEQQSSRATAKVRQKPWEMSS
jgi:hypothetical protein